MKRGEFLKIDCRCGNTISDSTDYLSHKAHLTPDQDIYGVWDGMEEQLINRVAAGELPVEKAYMVMRDIMSAPARLMYQCFECGRLYIDGPDGELDCFVPENVDTEKRILRSRDSK